MSGPIFEGERVIVVGCEAEVKGVRKWIVSHGIGEQSLRTMPLPPAEHPREVGAVWCEALNEWVIEPRVTP